jgi:hypothetical protein
MLSEASLDLLNYFLGFKETFCELGNYEFAFKKFIDIFARVLCRLVIDRRMARHKDTLYKLRKSLLDGGSVVHYLLLKLLTHKFDHKKHSDSLGFSAERIAKLRFYFLKQ